MHKVYQTFLRSADLPTWNDCLAAYSRSLGSSPEAISDEELVQGIVISLYIQWLSGVSGDIVRENSSRSESDRLINVLDTRRRHDPSAATTRGWAVIAGWRGYKALARQLIWESDAPGASRSPAGTKFTGLPTGIGPEVALMMVSKDPAQQTAEIRPFVSASEAFPFPPALWMYCGSLVRLGSIQQVGPLLKSSGLDSSNPFLLDLWGQIHERSGRWQDAMEAYQASSWPSHRYRAALCATITGHRRSESLEFDEAFIESLFQFNTEIDQVEIARCAEFVNACMWNTFDDWIVDFELGKLDFRRRRYAEADAHLKRALDHAPNPCKAAIASLRSSNLTWLSDNRWWADLTQRLNMRPEAMERTAEALEFACGEKNLESGQVWLAYEAKDAGLLPPSIADWTPYSQGLAHEFVGNRPEANSRWIECLETQYFHRSILPLIDVFRSARFNSCCEYLTDLIIRESWHDFFALWELADKLLSTCRFYSESSEEFSRVVERLRIASERMYDLAQSEFQHLFRAHEFFCEAGRQDIAESLLRRAASLAEGPAERLAIAVARRQLPWFNPADTDPQVRNLLEQAERESRDRLERLQIAREFFLYGQVQHARRILEEEGIFDETRRFDHIDYVIALQCGRWLKPEEFVGLAHGAIEALRQDLETGAIRRFEAPFLRRIVNSVSLIDPAFANRLIRAWVSPKEDDDATRKKPKDVLTGPWKRWSDAMQTLQDEDDSKGEQEAFLKKVAQLGIDRDFEDSLATWAWAQDQVYAALDTALTARPDDKDEPRPISKTLTLEEDPRAFELCDLWRRALGSEDNEARSVARVKIRTFYETEDRLIHRWEDLRRLKAEKPLRRALFYMEKSPALLDILASGLEETTHPALHGLRQGISEDCQRLRDHCAGVVRAIESELSPIASRLRELP